MSLSQHIALETLDRDPVAIDRAAADRNAAQHHLLKIKDGTEPPAAVIDLILVPGFDLHDLSALLDILYLTNRIMARPVFSWRVIGLQQMAVRASGGLTVGATYRLQEIADCDNALLLAGFDRPRPADWFLESWLRRQLFHGAHIGTVGGGAALLAEMELLQDRSCALHWAYIDDFRAKHRGVDFRDHIYRVDQGIITCSGGCGTTDLALACVRQLCGTEAMRRVADQLNRCVIRDDYDCQGNVSEPRHSITGQAAGIMRQHIEQPLSPAEIAARIGINLRRLQRAFRQYEKTTPTQFYMRERLLRARSMLRQSPASISEIARACGFASISDFAHNYQRMFGCRPSSDR